MAFVTGIIYILIGLVACFFGLRLYRIVLAFFGFAIGYGIGAVALAQQSGMVQFAGAIVAGLVLAVIFWALYKFAYVLFGLGLGVALGALIVAAFNIQDFLGLLIVIVFGVIGAFIGAALADVMIRLSTAFGGAVTIVSGLAVLGTAVGIALPLVDMTGGATATTDNAPGLISIVAVVILGVIGFLFQMQNDSTEVL